MLRDCCRTLRRRSVLVGPWSSGWFVARCIWRDRIWVEAQTLFGSRRAERPRGKHFDSLVGRDGREKTLVHETHFSSGSPTIGLVSMIALVNTWRLQILCCLCVGLTRVNRHGLWFSPGLHAMRFLLIMYVVLYAHLLLTITLCENCLRWATTMHTGKKKEEHVPWLC